MGPTCQNFRMRHHSLLLLLTACWVALGLAAPVAHAQSARFAAESAQIMKADADFAQSVAQRNRERFLAFLADVTTFGGGSPEELRGRDAVMKGWGDFFEADGPTLAWTPTHGEVIGAGDVGYTTGTALLRGTRADGTRVERRSEYLTVWKRQTDGSWKVIFDTGSTLLVPAH